MAEEEIIEPEWVKLLRKAFQEMPRKYGDYYHAATKAKKAFNRELAAATEQRLNPHVQELQQYSLEEKRELAYAVNRDLRLLNLCLKCPVTGLPAILIGDHGGDPEKYNRFRFEIHQDGRQLRKGYFQSIPHLDVIEAPPRTERGAHGWKGRPR
jgi:hypothetical protein